MKSIFLSILWLISAPLFSQWITPFGPLIQQDQGRLALELPESAILWEYEEGREGLLIYYCEDLDLRWAWPETGGQSYLNRRGEWYPFVLIQPGEPQESGTPSED